MPGCVPLGFGGGCSRPALPALPEPSAIVAR
nr:MAG TPA: hypothetical protein [Caudoviricetes sp.]